MYYLPAATNDVPNGNSHPNEQPSPHNLESNLAIALRLSEQEQRQIEEDLKREQEMIEEALRRSLEEK